MQVQFLGREDPLEEEMAPHSSILARRIPLTEKTLGDSEGQESLMCCSPWDCKESDKT